MRVRQPSRRGSQTLEHRFRFVKPFIRAFCSAPRSSLSRLARPRCLRAADLTQSTVSRQAFRRSFSILRSLRPSSGPPIRRSIQALRPAHSFAGCRSYGIDVSLVNRFLRLSSSVSAATVGCLSIPASRPAHSCAGGGSYGSDVFLSTSLLDFFRQASEATVGGFSNLASRPAHSLAGGG